MQAVEWIVLNPFEELYSRYHALVYGTALRILGDPIEAEDIAQNIFMRIYSRPGHFRGVNVGGWLTTLSKNAAIDRFRHMRLERRAEPQRELPVTESAEAFALRNLENRWIRNALGDLSREQRDLLIAIYFHGYSHRRIAKLANLPLGTVKTRIRSGMARLRRAAESEYLRSA